MISHVRCRTPTRQLQWTPWCSYCGPLSESHGGPPGTAVDPRRRATAGPWAWRRIPTANPCWRTAVVSWAWQPTHTKEPHQALQDQWQNSPYQQPRRGSHAPLRTPQACCSLEFPVLRVPRRGSRPPLESRCGPQGAAEHPCQRAVAISWVGLLWTPIGKTWQASGCSSRPPPVRIRGLWGVAAEPRQQSVAGLRV